MLSTELLSGVFVGGARNIAVLYNMLTVCDVIVNGSGELSPASYAHHSLCQVSRVTNSTAIHFPSAI
jgi:hypothetical protein